MVWFSKNYKKKFIANARHGLVLIGARVGENAEIAKEAGKFVFSIYHVTSSDESKLSLLRSYMGYMGIS